MNTNIPTLVKTSRTAQALTAGMTGQAVWTDWAAAQMSKDAYANNHVVFTCIHEISTSASMVPFRLVRKKDRTQFETHPILDLLNRPNPYQAFQSFWECVYAYYLLNGNSYIEAADMSASEAPSTVEELYCLPPNLVRVVLGQKGVGGYLFEGPTGMKVEYPVDMVNGQSFCMHWKTFNPDNLWLGQSAISAMGKSVDIHNSTNAWNKSLLDNGARPSGAFVYDDEDEGVLTEDQYKRLKQEVGEEYSGTKNAGKAMVLEGGMKWQAMSLSPMDMDFINSKNIAARDIAVSYGYPPVLLGLPEDNTYNNQKESRLALWTDTVMPLVGSLCGHLNRWLLPLFDENPEEIEIAPDYDDIGALQPIRDAQWKKAQETKDILTINERRELIRYPVIAGMDTMLVNSTVVPISFALQDPVEDSKTKPKPDDSKLIMREARLMPMEMKAAGTGDQREALTQNRLRIAMERSYRAKIESILDKAAREASTTYIKLKSSEAALSILTKETTKGLKPLLTMLYNSTAEVSGTRVFEGIKSIEGIEVKETNPESVFKSEVRNWVAGHALEQSAVIAGNSKAIAQKIFVQAISDKISIEETSRRLYKGLGGEVSKARARTMAATEIHQSYNVASEMAITATGIEVDKRWIALPGARSSHASVSGTVVGQNEKFSVGAAQLRFPGDPSTSYAEEVINCRCVVRYVPKAI